MRGIALAVAGSLLAPGVAAAGDPLLAAVGRALFERDWVAAPASTAATDGLGPLFNARSCAACHRGGGGAALALDPSGAPTGPGLVLRLTGDQAYGRQLQTAGIHGQPAEGTVRVTFVDLPPTMLAGGETVVLRRPRHVVENHDLAEPPGAVSPRLAPSLRGVGLLAAVPAADRAARADPEDRDRDGIRGRLGTGVLGLRAEQVGLDGQVAEALLLDLGLSTAVRPLPAGDCTPAQPECLDRVHGDRGSPGVEAGETILAAMVAYVASLPPPRRAGVPDPRGGQLFAGAGCAGCHSPTLTAVGGLSGPVAIAPYTDLLLHDLGPGLADEGDPATRLWRTAPLWGIGDSRVAGSGFVLLHDGRARGLQEAILWHGGEAEPSKERFRQMPAADRAALMAFMGSL